MEPLGEVHQRLGRCPQPRPDVVGIEVRWFALILAIAHNLRSPMLRWKFPPPLTEGRVGITEESAARPAVPLLDQREILAPAADASLGLSSGRVSPMVWCKRAIRLLTSPSLIPR